MFPSTYLRLLPQQIITDLIDYVNLRIFNCYIIRSHIFVDISH
jgi:hypothetical protein